MFSYVSYGAMWLFNQTISFCLLKYKVEDHAGQIERLRISKFYNAPK